LTLRTLRSNSSIQTLSVKSQRRSVLLQQQNNVSMLKFSSNITRQSVHMISNILVGPSTEEKLDSFLRSISASQEQRSLVEMVLSIFVRLCCQESPQGCSVVHGCSPMECSLPLRILDVQVPFRVDEVLHHVLQGILNCNHQRSESLIVLGVDVGCSVPQEDFEDSPGVCSNGRVEGSPPFEVDCIRIGSCVQEPFGSICSRISRSHVQGSLPCDFVLFRQGCS